MQVTRVLLVDDDPDIREITALSLETTMGWDVSAAATGEEALDLARSDPPDIVLLDVMMPGMDGITTFNHMKERPETRDIPVILLTAKVQNTDLDLYEEIGATGTVTKPFDPMKLGQLITNVLNHSD